MKELKGISFLFIASIVIMLCACSANEKLQVTPLFEASVYDLGDLFFPPVDYSSFASKTNNGIGREFIDGKWRYVDRSGNVLPYDHMRGFDDETSFSIVEKDGKFGVVNAMFDVVIPVDYANIVRAYKQYPDDSAEHTNWILYAEKEGHWLSIDLQNEIMVTFHPQKKKTNSSYSYSDFDVIIYDNDIKYIGYFGKRLELSIEMFLPAFDKQEFNVLTEGKLQSNKQIASFIKGSYEDDVNFIVDVDNRDSIAYIGEIEPYNQEVDFTSHFDADSGKYDIIFCGLNRNKMIYIVYLENDKSGTSANFKHISSE